MVSVIEDQIRARAQELWEEEGRPEGKAEEHWQRASAELRELDDSADSKRDVLGLSSTPQSEGTEPSGSQSSFGSTSRADTGNKKE